jgi:hypothetical protein
MQATSSRGDFVWLFEERNIFFIQHSDFDAFKIETWTTVGRLGLLEKSQLCCLVGGKKERKKKKGGGEDSH